MKIACDLACENVDRGGGPFGTVIVKDGNVIAAAGNSVTLDNDPTAHSEVNAIRRACSLIRNFKLDGCVVYCSSEPCPMCLSALYWAGVSRIYYGNTTADADRVNFGDDFIYMEIEKPHHERSVPCIHMEDTTAIEAFDKWVAKEDKIEY
ncbi:MAG: nucleoside deaminase [Muribaculaceae bacterium]|nr:nucleoside deaminase [Muribaculaceae bacterium]